MCEFKGCVFGKNLINVKFIKCKHNQTNLTEITVQDCLFEQTEMLDITTVFCRFIHSVFMDGEFSSKKNQKCFFKHNTFTRFNFLPCTVFENATFIGTNLNHLTFRKVLLHNTSFKNCTFDSVNLTQSSFNICVFTYVDIIKSSVNDNLFLYCSYDNYNLNYTNILRNSFEGSSMNHTKFERSNFSYNNLEKGSFSNIIFTFCITRDNIKTDATFCNSEMLTSSNLEVKCYFKDGFENTDAYIYTVHLISGKGTVLNVSDQVTCNVKTKTITFLLSYDLLNRTKIIKMEKAVNSTFGSFFPFSTNNEKVFKYIIIDDEMFLYGKKVINGKTILGFVHPPNKKKVRSKSL